jgi:predicted nuclease of restriction endonuclease-like (RecB) superfamily
LKEQDTPTRTFYNAMAAEERANLEEMEAEINAMLAARKNQEDSKKKQDD